MKLLKNLKIEKNINNLVSLALFGSYGTTYWRQGSSDIDILVVMEKREDVMDEFDLEEILEPIFKDYFEYSKIHLTFINMRDYDTVFARQYIDSDDKVIINRFKEIDFRLYVNKYLRNNDWLLRKEKEDTKLMEDNKGVTIL